MNKKYQIFISSTYVDLVEPRSKVIEAILKLYHFPIGMEMFSAADDEQWQIIEETIDSSDFYIILVGNRYGSLTKEGISFTEKEYDYAKKIGVPILTFVKDETLATTPQERENDPAKIQKLQDFRLKVQENKMREVWTNSDDLAHRVSMALMKQIPRKNRVGWIRGDSISEDATKELVALSKENRELKEELSQLRELIGERNPVIELDLHDVISVDLAIPQVEWNEFLIDSLEALPLEVPEGLEEELSLSSIREYNKNIPSPLAIDDYNQKIKEYYLSTFSKPFDFSIKNDGNSKANYIDVYIKFPDFVKVVESVDIENKSYPKDIFPENPVEAAQKRLMTKRRMGYLFPSMFSSNDYITSFPSMKNLPSFDNKNFTLKIQKNSVIINTPYLLHTRYEEILDELVIIPLCTGRGEISLNFICEEMESSESLIIPITVSTDKTLDFKRETL
ncbi:DUF4062 domain-containing protein [Psychrobacter sp. PAMC 21119]|uniref:DUF4062 domain-containing protein n=1 Tax=Psychrobacter sp. PAMC 21119 TaxID=1112209 RepID=UPI00028898B9|nr:DUF4062 domain-containing protein [Psychrobacter sp. PAMC 21119]